MLAAEPPCLWCLCKSTGLRAHSVKASIQVYTISIMGRPRGQSTPGLEPRGLVCSVLLYPDLLKMGSNPMSACAGLPSNGTPVRLEGRSDMSVSCTMCLVCTWAEAQRFCMMTGIAGQIMHHAATDSQRAAAPFRSY
jgi:hypothetical protein